MSKRVLFTSFLCLLCLRSQDAALEHARAVNLERAAKLPNFLADETAVRYKSRHTDPPQWQYVDTIESEIGVQGGGFSRQHMRVNGKPWNQRAMSGFNWSVQFGEELRQAFSPDCPTKIDFEGRAEARGKPALAYRFSCLLGILTF